MPNDARPALVVCLALTLSACSDPPVRRVACEGGRAAGYPCFNIDLAAFMPLSDFGAENASDIWGYYDPQSERELALLGLSDATAFVDITDPGAPVYLGHLPAPGLSVLTFGQWRWRYIKVYDHYAIVVTESFGSGAQIIDLNTVLDADVGLAPHRFVESALYGHEGELEATRVDSAVGGSDQVTAQHPQGPRVPSGLTDKAVFNTHNVAVNEATGFAYLVGTNSCAGGLHMTDLQDPLNPTFAGCFSDEGYTHDVQCVVYQGPDLDYAQREICFALNGQVGNTVVGEGATERNFQRLDSAVVIVDVTDKAAPTLIARAEYPGASYAHQGWLTEDQRFFFSNDELDELTFGHNTQTYLWNLEDLDAPVLIGKHTHETAAIDHNLYVRGNLLFQTNYTAGLRVLQMQDLMSAQLTEIAYFDTVPDNDDAGFFGAWSSYPYLPSGTLIVSSIDEGLFILRPGF